MEALEFHAYNGAMEEPGQVEGPLGADPHDATLLLARVGAGDSAAAHERVMRRAVATAKQIGDNDVAQRPMIERFNTNWGIPHSS